MIKIKRGVFAIKTIKNFLIYLRTWIKFLIILLVGVAMIGGFTFATYKPTYSVMLNDEFVGYTDDKSKLQDKITAYVEEGDSKFVAFVELEKLPEYKMCLVKKNTKATDNEIFAKVIEGGTPYYKYYAISVDGQEKQYVATFEEAEEIINQLKAKNSKNKDNIAYAPKYSTELKDFATIETAVNTLYEATPVAKPKKVTSSSKKYASSGSVTTSKKMDYSNTALGISLVRPVSGIITSRFGVRSRGTHTGLDIAASKGTPIKAAAGGTVTYSGYKGSYGNLLVISHGNGVTTYYAHCNTLNVKAGQSVSQGQVIATVGSTGNSTGPHLHLEVRVNGVAKNPQNYVY